MEKNKKIIATGIGVIIALILVSIIIFTIYNRVHKPVFIKTYGEYVIDLDKTQSGKYTDKTIPLQFTTNIDDDRDIIMISLQEDSGLTMNSGNAIAKKAELDDADSQRDVSVKKNVKIVNNTGPFSLRKYTVNINSALDSKLKKELASRGNLRFESAIVTYSDNTTQTIYLGRIILCSKAAMGKYIPAKEPGTTEEFEDTKVMESKPMTEDVVLDTVEGRLIDEFRSADINVSVNGMDYDKIKNVSVKKGEKIKIKISKHWSRFRLCPAVINDFFLTVKGTDSQGREYSLGYQYAGANFDFLNATSVALGKLGKR